jgi:DNA-binding FadR family transcriptional regulator
MTPNASGALVVPPTGRGTQKAYEGVAAELYQQILRGERANGERLPNENALAAEFGVSRATIREALRLLAAQDLIRTAKGRSGGSYVQVPSTRSISNFIRGSLNALSSADHVTVAELLEARELLEVPAARLAAARRSGDDVARLRESTHMDGASFDKQAAFEQNRDFHEVVLEVSGNTLLMIAAQPVFSVLVSGFTRSSFGARFHLAVRHQHREIADAIDRGDSELAGDLMYNHLEYLRPTYERLWAEARSTGHPRVTRGR